MSTIEQIKYEGMREELTAELTEELTGRGIEAMQYYDKLMKDGKC